MPYTLEYQKTDGGVITTYSGKVTDEEYRQCLEDKLSLFNTAKSNGNSGILRYSLSDCADVTDFNVSVETMKAGANISKTVMETNQTVLMSVVAPNNHEFGMGRLWQAYIGSQGERARIFRTKEEAEEWIAQALAEPDKEV